MSSRNLNVKFNFKECPKKTVNTGDFKNSGDISNNSVYNHAGNISNTTGDYNHAGNINYTRDFNNPCDISSTGNISNRDSGSPYEDAF